MASLVDINFDTSLRSKSFWVDGDVVLPAPVSLIDSMNGSTYVVHNNLLSLSFLLFFLLFLLHPPPFVVISCKHFQPNIIVQKSANKGMLEPDPPSLGDMYAVCHSYPTSKC